VIVTHLHVVRIAIDESKADPPLVIDRYRMLPIAVAIERM